MPYHTEQSVLSSPDPLNDSAILPSPGKVRSSGVRRSLPLDGSSPRKQTFQLDVGNRLSPQKLLVTVEADHSEIELGHRSSRTKNSISPIRYSQPIVRQNVRTTTTTIPVKGLSDSEDDALDFPPGTPKRGRGRPRKSMGTPVPSKSRTRTVTPRAKPGARRRRTLGDLLDGDDSEDWDFEISAGVEISRGKGRSRSRSTKGDTRKKATAATKHNGSPERTAPSITSKQDRGRRKTLTPKEFPIHEDEPNNVATVGNCGHVEADVNGALALKDMNLVSTQSPFSTIRSSTTVGNDDPDVLLAKFSPAKKTPARTGWSSPRVLPASSADARAPATSQVAAPLPISSSRQDSSLNTAEKENSRCVEEFEKSRADEGEARYGIHELAEFDTILESEGFSMISVDSVPSLREHLSSPVILGQVYEESTPTTGNDQIRRANVSEPVGSEDSFSRTVPEPLGAATTGRKVVNTQLLKVRSANTSTMGDSFSSIPSEVLEAATPGRKILHDKLLTVKSQDHKGNDDSFSSIPPAILEAATPAKHNKVVGSSTASHPVTKAVESNLAVFPLPSVAIRVQSQNDSGLLSPEETPSPVDASSQLEQEGDSKQSQGGSGAHVHTMPMTDGCSIISSHVRSSPPSVMPRRFTYTAHLRQQRALHPYITETPSIVFSSPSLPPLFQQPPLNRTQASTSRGNIQPPRLSLSPIVRAGRVLQNIASTSPSRSRSQSLGSPFKSPVAPRISSGTNQTKLDSNSSNEKSSKPFKEGKINDGDIFNGFSDDTRRELRKSFVLGEEFARSQQNPKSTIDCIGVAQPEDPFGSGTQQLHSPSPEETGRYTLGLPTKTVTSEVFTVRSDGAMSWQPENTVALHTSQLSFDKSTRDQRQTKDASFQENTAILERRREAEWSRERAAVSSQIESASTSQVIVISSDDEAEDIWQAEARHSSSILDEQLQSVPSKQEPLEKPRRSKIPSPWRKNSKRLVYSDEVAQLSSQPRDEKPKHNPCQEAGTRPSESSQIEPKTQAPMKDLVEDDELPDSSIVWHIPQKLNFAPRPRSSGNLDLSALLGSSPAKAPLVNPQQDLKPKRPIAPLYPTLESSPEDTSPSSKSATADENTDAASVSYSTEESQVATEPSIAEEESEIATEPSITDSNDKQFSFPPANSPSPQKSCLRTPTSISPTKSVTFKSPTPPPPPLSSTEWSKKHWQRLDAIWKDYRSLLADEYGNALITPDDESAEISRWLGKTVSVKGYSLVITRWHLDIVADFTEEVPGWEEGYIVKRLVALIVGEQMRRDGKAKS